MRTEVLLRRLLNTHILRSCNTIFDAFDDSVMFLETSAEYGELFGSSQVTIKAIAYVRCISLTRWFDKLMEIQC